MTLPEGRPVTFTVIVIAFAASATWNLYGAANMYYGLFATVVFVAMVASAELLALLVLRHVVEDWTNNNELKALLGAVLYGFCIYACVISGHRAFEVQAIQQRETNAFEEAKATRHKEQAAIHDAKAKAASLVNDRDTEAANIRLRDSQLAQAHTIELAVEMKQPMTGLQMWAFIVLFELVKTAGRWSLATPSKARWNWHRRQIQKLKDKAALKSAQEKYGKEAA